MRVLSVSIAISAALSASMASAQDWGSTEADSRSSGRAEDGTLSNAFPLDSDGELVVVREHRYGTRELVGLLHRAADRVAREAPGAQLSVGDLSAQEGGHLSPHVSHQSGRDADVAFYVLDAAGRPLPRAMFVRFTADGTGRRNGNVLRFDDRRNWELMVAFVDDPMAELQHVLIVDYLRERLMEYGRQNGASEDFLDKVRRVTHPIRGSENHDDHFHIRIYCSVGDRPACVDALPLHPWYDGTPSPRDVAAARVADDRRAAALRRDAEVSQRAEAELRSQEQRQRDAESGRAAELAREPERQTAQERRRFQALERRERQQRAEQAQSEARLLSQMRQWESRERRNALVQEREERRRLAQLQRESDQNLVGLPDPSERSEPTAVSTARVEEQSREVERRRQTNIAREQRRQQQEERRRAVRQAREERSRETALVAERRRQQAAERVRARRLRQERQRAEVEAARDVVP